MISAGSNKSSFNALTLSARPLPEQGLAENARGSRGPRTPRRAACFLLAVTLALASFAYGLPVGQSRAADNGASLMGVYRLNAEAEHMFYLLLLTEAVSTDDKAMLFTALRGVLRYERDINLYREGASLLYRSGRLGEAQTIIESGLLAFPEDIPLTILQAIIFSDNGNEEEATKLLEQALLKNPSSAELLQELMRRYVKAGRTAEAEQLFLRLPVADFDAQLLLLRAHILASTGRDAEAKDELKGLLQKQPDFIEAWIELGLLLEKEQNFSGAADAYKKALEIDSSDFDLMFRIFLMQIEAKMPDQALKSIKKFADEADVDNDFLFQAVGSLLEANYLDEAEEVLQLADDRGGHPDQLVFYRALLEYRRTDDALKAASMMDEVKPDSPYHRKAVMRKLAILLNGKAYDEAIETAEEARKLYPDGVELWDLEAFSLSRLGRFKEAVQLLRDAAKQFPGNEDVLYALAGVLTEAGQSKEAMKIMEKIVADNPDSARALNYIGYTLAEENRDLERAYELIVKASQLSPEADFIVDSLAWVLYRLERYDEAWAAIQRAVELGAEDAEVWEHYGDIAVKVGKPEEARRAYEEALKMEPKNPDALKEKLKGLGKAGK